MSTKRKIVMDRSAEWGPPHPASAEYREEAFTQRLVEHLHAAKRRALEEKGAEVPQHVQELAESL